MRHGLSKKNGMPKKHDPKKREEEKNIWTHEGPSVKKNIYHNNIAMTSCYPNKGERDS